MTKLCLLIIVFLFTGCVLNKPRVRKSNIAGKIYVVKKADTIQKIADYHGVNVEEIKLINNINNNLKFGQKIYIPVKEKVPIKVNKPVNKQKLVKQEPIKRTLLFPVKNGSIIKNFSRTKKDPYDGIAIKTKLGSKVFAAEGGKVIFVGDDNTAFGLLIIIEHKNKLITVYTHLQKALVNENQHVKQGQTIGLVGISKQSSSPLLHFQVRKEQKPQDPKLFFN